jgi:large subunit ribosomal protein LP2
MKHMAVYLMLKLGGNDAPTVADVQKALSSVGIDGDEARCKALVDSLEGKDLAEVLAEGKDLLATFGGGGGGGGAAAAGGDAAEEKEEEKVEEEEMDMGGAMDMFGGEEGTGDY